MKAAPKADITSDEFEVLVAHNLNNLLIQLLFMTIYFGFHPYIKKRVTMLKGKDIKISIQEKHHFQMDGEVLDSVSQVQIKKSLSREFIAFNRKDIKNIAKKFHS